MSEIVKLTRRSRFYARGFTLEHDTALIIPIFGHAKFGPYYRTDSMTEISSTALSSSSW
jgi:hypothetical protein